MLLILCFYLNGFVFFCVSELVLFCSLNGLSIRFELVLFNGRRFMSLCSYILEHCVYIVILSVCCVWFWIFWVYLYCEYIVFNFEFSKFVFDFEFFGCVCIVSMLCLILNFLGLYLILNFFGFVFNFEFFGEKKKPKFFFFKSIEKRSYRSAG